ncbi:MAG: putative PEP-binding protein [bacterium]
MNKLIAKFIAVVVSLSLLNLNITVYAEKESFVAPPCLAEISHHAVQNDLRTVPQTPKHTDITERGADPDEWSFYKTAVSPDMNTETADGAVFFANKTAFNIKDHVKAFSISTALSGILILFLVAALFGCTFFPLCFQIGCFVLGSIIAVVWASNYLSSIIVTWLVKIFIPANLIAPDNIPLDEINGNNPWADKKYLHDLREWAVSNQADVKLVKQAALKIGQLAVTEVLPRRVEIVWWLIARSDSWWFNSLRRMLLPNVLDHEYQRLNDKSTFNIYLTKPGRMIKFFLKRIYIKLLSWISKSPEIRIEGDPNQKRDVIEGKILLYRTDLEYAVYSLRTPWDTDAKVAKKVQHELDSLDQMLGDLLRGVDNTDIIEALRGMANQARNDIERKEMNAEFVLSKLIDKHIELIKGLHEDEKIKISKRLTSGTDDTDGITAGDDDTEYDDVSVVPGGDGKEKEYTDCIAAFEGFKDTVFFPYFEQRDSIAGEGEVNRIKREIELCRSYVYMTRLKYIQLRQEYIDQKKDDKIPLLNIMIYALTRDILPKLEQAIKDEKLSAHRILSKYSLIESIERMKRTSNFDHKENMFSNMAWIVHAHGDTDADRDESNVLFVSNKETMSNIANLITLFKMSPSSDISTVSSGKPEARPKRIGEERRFLSVFNDVQNELDLPKSIEKLDANFSNIHKLLDHFKRDILKKIHASNDDVDVITAEIGYDLWKKINDAFEFRPIQEHDPAKQSPHEQLLGYVENFNAVLNKKLRRKFVPRESLLKEKSLILVVQDMNWPLLQDLIDQAVYPNIKAIISRTGTPTAHWVIMAQGEGIQTLTSVVGNFKDIIEGQKAFLRGAEGILFVNPKRSARKSAEKQMIRDIALQSLADKRAQFPTRVVETQDGNQLLIGANATEEKELETARKVASFNGLFRAEFATRKFRFSPAAAEVRKYKHIKDVPDDILAALRADLIKYEELLTKKLLSAMEGMTNGVVFRTFDYAPDKLVSGIPASHYKGLDFYFKDVFGGEILRANMRSGLNAQYQADQTTGSIYGPVKLEFPQLRTSGEKKELLSRFRSVKQLFTKKVRFRPRNKAERTTVGKITPDDGRVKSAGKIQVGYMIETPEALEIFESDILPSSSFCSIGSNDLTRYLFKLPNREDPKYARYYTRLQPRMLYEIEQLVKKVQECHNKKNKIFEISLCGEFAGNPLFVIFAVYLAGTYGVPFGLTVDSSQVALIKHLIRNISFEEVREKVFQRYEAIDDKVKKNENNERYEDLEKEINRLAEAMHRKIMDRIYKSREFKKELPEARRKYNEALKNAGKAHAAAEPVKQSETAVAAAN